MADRRSPTAEDSALPDHWDHGRELLTASSDCTSVDVSVCPTRFFSSCSYSSCSYSCSCSGSMVKRLRRLLVCFSLSSFCFLCFMSSLLLFLFFLFSCLCFSVSRTRARPFDL